MTVHISTEYKGITFHLDSTPGELRSDLYSVREAIDQFLNEEPGAAVDGDAGKDKPAAEPSRKKAATKQESAPKKDAAPSTKPAKDDTQEEPETPESTKGGPAEDETPDTPVITLDQLRQQVMAYAEEHGNAKGKQLVEKFGASKISDIPEDKYHEVYVAAGGEA